MNGYHSESCLEPANVCKRGNIGRLPSHPASYDETCTVAWQIRAMSHACRGYVLSLPACYSVANKCCPVHLVNQESIQRMSAGQVTALPSSLAASMSLILVHVADENAIS